MGVNIYIRADVNMSAGRFHFRREYYMEPILKGSSSGGG